MEDELEVDPVIASVWLALGRLKELVLVVKFRILLKNLEAGEQLELLMLEFCESDIAVSRILGCQEDFR